MHHPSTPTISVQKNTDKDVWIVKLYFPDTKRRVRASLGIPLSEDPTTALAEWKQEALTLYLEENDLARAAEEKKHGSRDNPTLAHVFDWFTGTHLVHAGVKQKTIDAYERTLLSFRTYCNTRHASRVQQVSWRLIQEWQIFTTQHRPQPTTTAERTDIQRLRYVFEQALDAGVITQPLEFKFKIPPAPKGSRYAALDVHEVRAFYTALELHAPAIHDPTWWIYLTGWLPSDFLDFRISQINFARNTFNHVRFKTGYQMQDYPITEDMRAVIDRNLRGRPQDSPEPLFLDPKGRPWEWRRNVVLQAFSRPVAEVGPAAFHPHQPNTSISIGAPPVNLCSAASAVRLCVTAR